jgi:hypothetical protein
LAQYQGPVDVRIVTGMVQKDHPVWKLPERRVNKFVKRYQSQHTNPTGADDDETTSTSHNRPSSTRNVFRTMFSPKNKGNSSSRTNNKNYSFNEPISPSTTAAQQQQQQEAALPSPARASSPIDPTPSVQQDGIGTPTEQEPTVAAATKEVQEAQALDTDGGLKETPSIDIAYETDDNVVTGKEAFHCDVCNIM